jgi:two-component system cell cycle response regulator
MSCNLPVRLRVTGPVLTGVLLGVLVLAYLTLSLLLPQSDPLMGFFRTYVHSGLMVAAAGIGVLATVRSRGERLAWGIMAVGLVAFAGGEMVWRFVYADDASPPYPSWADALWLTTYPAFYVALMLLLRARVAAFMRGAWLDGLIASTATAAVGVTFYFAPVLARSDGDAVAIAMTMAYPLGDLLLWVLLLAVLALAGWRMTRGFALLAAGQIAVTVGDAVLAIQTAAGTYVEGRWADVMWPLGVLLIAAAGLERPPVYRVRALAGWRTVVIPAVFVTIAGALQVLHGALGLPLTVDALISVTFLLVLCRAGLALRDNLTLVERSRVEATTDALSGLGNRRALLSDLDAALSEGRQHTLVLFDLDGFKSYNDAFGHAAGDALLSRLGSALDASVRPGRAYRLGGDEFCVLTPLAGPEAERALATAGHALGDEGESFRITASHGAATLPIEASDASTALQLVDQRMYAHKNPRRAASARRESHEVLLGVLDECEPGLNGHVQRVAEWALAVGRRLGLTGEALDELYRAAQLHDIGKTAIPDVILSKRGPLDDDEWRFMRQHTLIGERIVARAPALRPVAKIVRASHERFDGNGYPDRLAGTEIPLAARIILVCDAADALTSDRPYRPAQPLEVALAELVRCSGTHFDPRVVEAFCAVATVSPVSAEPAPARPAATSAG